MKPLHRHDARPYGVHRAPSSLRLRSAFPAGPPAGPRRRPCRPDLRLRATPHGDPARATRGSTHSLHGGLFAPPSTSPTGVHSHGAEAPFRPCATTRQDMFRPCGSSPLRRLAPPEGRPACCSRLPILGFAGFHDLRCVITHRTGRFPPTPCPPEHSPPRAAVDALPHRSCLLDRSHPDRGARSSRPCAAGESVARSEGVPPDRARYSPGLPLFLASRAPPHPPKRMSTRLKTDHRAGQPALSRRERRPRGPWAGTAAQRERCDLRDRPVDATT